MKSPKLFAPIFAALLLNGCASTYTPPTDARSAKLNIVNRTGGTTYATAFIQASDCSGGKLIISPNGIAPYNSLEIQVATGTDFSFLITTAERISVSGTLIQFESCFFPISFTPTTGSSYTATFDVAPSQGGCSISITGEDKNGNTIDAKARKRMWRKPFLESGSFCHPEPQ